MFDRWDAIVYLISFETQLVDIPRQRFGEVIPRQRFGEVGLLEKRFIVIPEIYYWCRLVTVTDTNNGGLTTRY
jgi:hypothetical protein